MDQITSLLTKYFGEEISCSLGIRGDTVVTLHNASKIVEMMELLRDNGFTMLIDVTAVHYPGEDADYHMIYNLLAMEPVLRILVRVPLVSGEGDPEIDSVAHVFKTANWLEREVYDMFGVRFHNHPNLKRILMWDTYKGHPLRKDFPLEGDNLHCYD